MQGPAFASHRTLRSNAPDLVPPRDAQDDAKTGNPTSTESNHIPLGHLGTRQPHHRTRQPHHRNARPDRTNSYGGGPGAAADRNPPGETGCEAPEPKKTPIRRLLSTLRRHLAFVGPGIIASVAYLDPGNYVTDLAAGSQYGYSHLFVVLFAGLMALLFQILSTRLGCVSDYDLATHCRFALYDRPGPYKLWYRWGALYPLWFMAEAGIIMTDLAELLGSAIAINLLIPAIPLWACVLLTSLDVFLILLIFNQYPSRTMTKSMRAFEILIGLLVLTVLASFVAMLVKVGPDWGKAFYGFVPSSGIINNGAIYIAVGIIGATVMPHAFYIGSKMATMRRLTPEQYGEEPNPDDYDSDEYFSEDEEQDNEDEDVRKADLAATANERPGRTRTRSGSDEPVRPWVPFLHLPQPMRLPSVGFDLSKLSRIRTDSRDRSSGAASTVPARRRSRRASGVSRSGPTKTSESNLGAHALHPASSRPHAGIDDIVVLAERDESVPDLSDPAKQAADPDCGSATKKPTRRPGSRRPGPTLACVRAHLNHACIDVAGSLLGFALVVNSAILILGAAVFYYGSGRTSSGTQVSDLFDAYYLIKQYLGQALAYVFAIALLTAGQSASLTVTLSGQIVSEGMIRWRTKPWKRRLVTRCIGIIPSLAVAVSVGRHGIDALLVGSQVALSIVLTFVLVPLIIFTSQHSVMAVPINKEAAARRDEVFPPPRASAPSGDEDDAASPTTRSALAVVLKALDPRTVAWRRLGRTLNPIRRRSPPPEGYVSYANSVPVIYLCCALWWIIGICNVYALYQVANP